VKKNTFAVIRNSKGQVAIFVALLFQVLFVFFAMIVNVGLLVHHKINLQNSVDLAAYYGAMKQAEMLNAIGHVNYQIRQSYKLLTFRYQQFGTAGTTESGQNPYYQGKIQTEKDEPVGYDAAFCIPYTPVDIMLGHEGSQSYCRKIDTMQVPLPGVPSFAASTAWTGFQGGFIAAANVLKESAMRFCKYSMSMNWFQLAKFIGAYKLDIRNRKKLLLGLANELSKEDPRDIQGDSIKDGAYQTFYKNLTGPNKEGFRESTPNSSSTGFEFKFVNSFSIGSCRGNPTEVSPPGWLKEIFIYPMFAAYDGECDASDALKFKPTLLNNSGDSSLGISPNIPPELRQSAQDLVNLATEAPSSDPQRLLYRASIGFEKDPWCVGYFGISATATPKIPFSPFGAVKLKATAYAKPFGGRVGPWYGQTWDYSEGSDTKSNDSRGRMDTLLPLRVSANQVMGAATLDQLKKLKDDKRLFPNHSRYLGDKWGVVTELTTGQFAKAIHEKMPVIKLGWYNHLQDQDMDSKSSQGDILAWDKEGDKTVPMRDLELAAIAPDQFDTATYSIDPDFYNNYVLKIQKGYGNQFQFLIRGDLGSRMQGPEDQKRFSIRNQIQGLENPSKNMVDTKEKLTYYLNEFAQVLTSWQQKTPDQYILDSERFGRCLTQNSDAISQNQSDEKFFTMGSCKAGGRTGYSVKLVDGKFLRNEVDGAPTYSLGGEGTSGKIKNPPTNF
jgi:hypothetical protein